MFVQEIRLLLTAHKKILAGIGFLAFFCVLSTALVLATAQASLLPPFSIGVVDNDGSPEIEMLLQILASHEAVNKVVSFQRMDIEEAQAFIRADQIPAYVVVPPGFTQGVMVGENPPVSFVGNDARVIQSSVARLLVSAGIAFVTVSQAGIYSALELAAENGVDWETLNNNVVMPLNIAYLRELINYNDYFLKTEVVATGDIPHGEYYFNSAFIFLAGILLISFMDVLFRAAAPGIMHRYRMCGIPLIKVMFTKWIALCFVLLILLSPAFFLYGSRLLALAIFLGGLGLMCSQLFGSEPAAGIFLFFFSSIMVLVSGGALPLAYLPEVFAKISVLAPNYWFIRINSAGALPVLVLTAYGVLFFIVALVKARVYPTIVKIHKKM